MGDDVYGMHAVYEIEDFLKATGVPREWIGIVCGPQLDENEEAIRVQYNVRVVDGPVDDTLRYDLDYYFEDEDMGRVVHEIYPAMVETLEKSFPDAEIQYMEPERE